MVEKASSAAVSHTWTNLTRILCFWIAIPTFIFSITCFFSSYFRPYVSVFSENSKGAFILFVHEGRIALATAEIQQGFTVPWTHRDTTLVITKFLKGGEIKYSGQSTMTSFGGLSAPLYVVTSQSLSMGYWLWFWGLLPFGWFAIRFLIQIGQLPKRGVCQFCGYDMRASPKRCSECGAKNPGYTGTFVD